MNNVPFQLQFQFQLQLQFSTPVLNFSPQLQSQLQFSTPVPTSVLNSSPQLQSSTSVLNFSPNFSSNSQFPPDPEIEKNFETGASLTKCVFVVKLDSKIDKALIIAIPFHTPLLSIFPIQHIILTLLFIPDITVHTNDYLAYQQVNEPNETIEYRSFGNITSRCQDT
jgi:hypothetical protein